ncbi:CPBP family intramembrane metalloprotease [Hymenobacter sp. BT770]|uniref:CPBP family intramembrane glutamic endopeptidase n=1 Tax=Hymenobacter sp. BT770 TaxID=2886942 RepID=UPI001D10538F|nr:CPBP family intramembrane glutamic endopeptidase [Hymenobacter sp. BT770]MCC3153707.1 CPBP family intramembrane metalloprotease [Hymenobacter sp. BT770]MDO3413670.1 CPBP family intramembrane metalloprotease [Hymenobacter sp. BT770]
MKGFLPRALHPGLQVLMLLVLLVAGACVGYAVIFAWAKVGFGLSVPEVGKVMTYPAAFPQGWGLLMMAQGVLLFSACAGGALALASALGYSWAEYFNPRRLGAGWWLVAAALLIVVILPFMSTLIAWNAAVHFPAVLHDFEVWARASEDRAQNITQFLTRFSTNGRFLAALLVIALVPAVSEELVFRGVIQKNLVRWFSPHVGVWLGAAIFSAIHFQFFGFVPRFVLGLVLGYLYLWSGNILVSMAAHFTQNAFQLLILYLTQHGHFGWGFDPDATEALPWWLVVPSALLTVGLLYFLHERMSAPAAPTHMLTLSHRGIEVRSPKPSA